MVETCAKVLSYRYGFQDFPTPASPLSIHWYAPQPQILLSLLKAG